MMVIFDLIYKLFGFAMYSIALICTYFIISPFWSQNTFIQLLQIALSYFVFINCFTITAGFMRYMLQPRLIEGQFAMPNSQQYRAYMINSVIYNTYIASPFAKYALSIFYLKWIFFRLFGMKLPKSSLLSFESTIKQPELIEIGEKTLIGQACTIVCHISPNLKTHIQKKVKIGSNTCIGGQSAIGPGSTIGSNTLIGAKNNISMDVKIGNNVQTGFMVTFSTGVEVPDNVKVRGHSLITRDCKISPGETWGGNPAKKLK